MTLPAVSVIENKDIFKYTKYSLFLGTPVWALPFAIMFGFIIFLIRALRPSEPLIQEMEPTRVSKDHGDIKDMIWEDYCPKECKDSRYIIKGHAALVNPKTGVIYAIGSGLQILVKIPGLDADSVYRLDLKTQMPKNTKIDTQKHVGKDWYFLPFSKKADEVIALAYSRSNIGQGH